MSIKQLDELRPVVLGLVKIGDKGGNRGAPRKFNGFRLYLPDKDENGQPIPDSKTQSLLEKKYGNPLRKLPVFFLTGTRDSCMDSSYSWYGHVGMDVAQICKGNGKEGHRIEVKGEKIQRDADGWAMRKTVTCPCEKFDPALDADKKVHPCKWSMKLAFMLQDVPKGGGLYLFRSHSMHTIRSIHFALTQMESFTLGQMAGIPVNLVWQMGRNSRNAPIPVVRLEWDFDPTAMRLKAIEHVREMSTLRKEIEAAEGVSRRLLTMEESQDEVDDITQEFYGEQSSEDAVEECSEEEFVDPGQREADASESLPDDGCVDGDASPLVDAGERRALVLKIRSIGVDDQIGREFLVVATGKESTASLTRDEFRFCMKTLSQFQIPAELMDWMREGGEGQGDEDIPF